MVARCYVERLFVVAASVDIDCWHVVATAVVVAANYCSRRQHSIASFCLVARKSVAARRSLLLMAAAAAKRKVMVIRKKNWFKIRNVYAE